jgi:hypothetical protein
MGKIVIGLYGAGGFGKEVMSLLPTILPTLFPQTPSNDIKVCFIDDDPVLKQVMEHEVLSLDEFAGLKLSELYYCITIADPISRKLVALKMKNTNIQALTLLFNNAIILSQSQIGIGSIVIDNFVTISPSVTCCGNTDIKEGAFIGAGSIIKQGTNGRPRYIGINSILGMGSNLLNDLPDNKTYAGNPAIDLKS